jgi:hypothetical protein
MFAASEARWGCLLFLWQQVFTCVHPHGWLEGSAEVVPGIHTGGMPAAIEAVQSGKVDPRGFKFFSGYVALHPSACVIA